MSPRPPFPKLPPVPPSPVKPLREIVRQSRQQVEKAGDDIHSLASELRSAARLEAPETANKAPPEQKTTATTTQEPEIPKQEAVATACVPCALGHFSTTAGLLNEAVRFKKEGITSNEVLDRIAKTLQELNALERVDLTPEKIRSAPDWERDIAEEALQQSRNLRHRLETIKDIEELEQAAADTEGYYRSLNRVWWKRRFAKTSKTEPEMSLEEAKQLAADAASKEVERKWQSQEKR